MSGLAITGARRLSRLVRRLGLGSEGSALLEFAVALPLLTVFVVGIFDFSGAFNQKQKLEQAAQEGAILAAAQPTSDISASGSANPAGNPLSVQAVVTAVYNSLVASGVVASGSCSISPVPAPTTYAGLSWTYTITGCTSNSSDNLMITVNRGWACSSGTPCAAAPPVSVGTMVTVSFPYHWRFNSVIQTLIPGATYSATTQVTESAISHNQT
jgi:hypothetical protein